MSEDRGKTGFKEDGKLEGKKGGKGGGLHDSHRWPSHILSLKKLNSPVLSAAFQNFQYISFSSFSTSVSNINPPFNTVLLWYIIRVSLFLPLTLAVGYSIGMFNTLQKFSDKFVTKL